PSPGRCRCRARHQVDRAFNLTSASEVLPPAEGPATAPSAAPPNPGIAGPRFAGIDSGRFPHHEGGDGTGDIGPCRAGGEDPAGVDPALPGDGPDPEALAEYQGCSGDAETPHDRSGPGAGDAWVIGTHAQLRRA